MRVPLTIRCPALGLEIELEAEIPDEVLRPTAPAETLDTAQLRERWRCSARTLSRLRNTGKLPYMQPSPRRYLYRLAEIEQVEQDSARSALRAVPRRVVGGSEL